MDGRKNNNGSHLKKDAGSKKKPVTIYETPTDIALLGGKANVRKIMKYAVEKALAKLKTKIVEVETSFADTPGCRCNDRRTVHCPVHGNV